MRLIITPVVIFLFTFFVVIFTVSSFEVEQVKEQSGEEVEPDEEVESDKNSNEDISHFHGEIKEDGEKSKWPFSSPRPYRDMFYDDDGEPLTEPIPCPYRKEMER